MKKILISFSFILASLAVHADDIMKKEADGTYVINTTELCKARGYRGHTPLEVHIKANKIVKIVPLANRETPSYYKIVLDAMYKQYNGLKVSKAAKLSENPEVDGTTGATFSSKAIQLNIKAALDYYKANK